jgi:hypothetical protein
MLPSVGRVRLQTRTTCLTGAGSVSERSLDLSGKALVAHDVVAIGGASDLVDDTGLKLIE